MMSGFTFQWPAMLAFLPLVLPLGWLLARARRQRLGLMNALGARAPTHRRLRDGWRLAAFALLVLALARPGYAPRMEAVSQAGRDVVFALDVSRSMLAEDVSPNRLEVAKQAIRDALQVMGSERVGLIVYAGSASILCPLTYDDDFVRYMLEQVHPRSVDFGGTTLQAAVEKAVDQVFMEGREGVQDLVVLTDGGDHGSQTTRVVELLEEKQVEVLVIGLGDPHRESPIRIQDAEGNTSLLESNGKTVTTKLEDDALRTFAAQSPHTDYLAAGVAPFNLGQIYLDNAAGKQVEAAAAGNVGVRVYQEAAVFFLVPALVLLFLSECGGMRGLAFTKVAIGFSWLALVAQSEAATSNFRADFDAAVKLMEEQAYHEAQSRLTLLYARASESTAEAGDLAALQVNRGLCLLELSKARAEEAPGIALAQAREAQLAFLSAKRYVPGLRRAGVRLESTAQWMLELQEQIEEQEQAAEELNAEIDALVERLRALLEAQINLRQTCQAQDVNRHRPKRPAKAPAPPPVVAPETAPEDAASFVKSQLELLGDADLIVGMMPSIDARLAPPDPRMPPVETLMGEPLKLMQEAKNAQQKASRQLAFWRSWPAARASQQSAEQAIKKILEILVGNSQQQSEENDDWEEEDDDEPMTESEEGMMSSETRRGDFAAGRDMQELPVPNYSAEDILLEEQGSLQFRQQKRARAHAAQVEKDY